MYVHTYVYQYVCTVETQPDTYCTYVLYIHVHVYTTPLLMLTHNKIDVLYPQQGWLTLSLCPLAIATMEVLAWANHSSSKNKQLPWRLVSSFYKCKQQHTQAAHHTYTYSCMYIHTYIQCTWHTYVHAHTVQVYIHALNLQAYTVTQCIHTYVR